MGPFLHLINSNPGPEALLEQLGQPPSPNEYNRIWFPQTSTAPSTPTLGAPIYPVPGQSLPMQTKKASQIPLSRRLPFDLSLLLPGGPGVPWRKALSRGRYLAIRSGQGGSPGHKGFRGDAHSPPPALFSLPSWAPSLTSTLVNSPRIP